ncbi:hypothetical protein QVD17_36889 [Tagetes erecta]|uniref:Uncharacterized protein n=1 Tax=Tagetes erecta TaxID=13708 RepID=A0AAD8JV13_TARER|nr:hypothetical protein QVD17_36889 [Tagetes erecta]
MQSLYNECPNKRPSIRTEGGDKKGKTAVPFPYTHPHVPLYILTPTPSPPPLLTILSLISYHIYTTKLIKLLHF